MYIIYIIYYVLYYVLYIIYYILCIYYILYILQYENFLSVTICLATGCSGSSSEKGCLWSRPYSDSL